MPVDDRALYARKAEKDQPDYYPTPYFATRMLCRWLERQGVEMADRRCIEPAAGGGHMADVLSEYFGEVTASDIHDYGRGYIQCDFLKHPMLRGNGRPAWCITNPPYNLATEFAERMLDMSAEGCALLCRNTFAESRKRYDRLFEPRPPSHICQFVQRVAMVHGGLAPPGTASTTTYAWFVWIGTDVQHTDTLFRWLHEDSRGLHHPPAGAVGDGLLSMPEQPAPPPDLFGEA